MSEAVGYWSIRDWSKLQHYKNRNPPWIKLHRDVIDDYEFSKLPDASKAHLMLIWVYASQNDGRVPNDPKFLSRKLGLEKAPNLKLLVNGGFLIPEHISSIAPASSEQHNSDLLAECNQNAPLEEERRGETEERRVRAAAKRRMPADFAISDRVRTWAEKKGHTRLEERFESFVSKAAAKGYTYADWDEGFMTSIREDWAKLSGKPVNGSSDRVMESFT